MQQLSCFGHLHFRAASSIVANGWLDHVVIEGFFLDFPGGIVTMIFPHFQAKDQTRSHNFHHRLLSVFCCFCISH